jgi:hypothetical protein
MDGRNPEMFEKPVVKVLVLHHGDADGFGAAGFSVEMPVVEVVQT